MTNLSFRKRWIILPVYLLGGLILGVGDLDLGQLVQQLGARPGFATALSVNVLLPLLAIGLGVAIPLLRTAWLGAIGMTAAYIVGLAIVHPPARPVSIVALLGSVPPVLVMACLSYGVLGTLAALAARTLAKMTEIDPPASGV
jgi:hypothetical protein